MIQICVVMRPLEYFNIGEIISLSPSRAEYLAGINMVVILTKPIKPELVKEANGWFNYIKANKKYRAITLSKIKSFINRAD